MRSLGDVANGVLADLDKPVRLTPKIITAPADVEPEPAPHIPLSARAPHRGYLARELVQCTLPHRDPGQDVYIRTDGKYRLMIESGTNINTGEKIGLPYGSLPRLLMLFVNSEAVRKQGREDELIISFGNTMNDFLRNVGCNPATGGGKRGDAARIRAQHDRLFNARFTFAQSEGNAVFGSETRRPIEIATEIRTFWDYRNPDQGSFWESYIKLTQDFQQAIVNNPVPFDLEHLKALKRSALAIDLYCWLTYRLFRADGEGFTVPYAALHRQFGTGYARERAFRQAVLEELKLVSKVYSQIRCEFTPRGLLVDAVSRRDLPVPSEVKPKPPTTVPHNAPLEERPYNTMRLIVMGPDLQKIDRLARKLGMSIDDVMPRWRAWCAENRIYPQNPAAHLTNFIKNHEPGR